MKEIRIAHDRLPQNKKLILNARRVTTVLLFRQHRISSLMKEIRIAHDRLPQNKKLILNARRVTTV
ncbi:hypothetical protein, partial [Salmonella enterica]|uniref:hypothetical protein n=1 Tax=Salmonella enterica TaxID=28901 RepID=UPI0026035904